VLVLICNYQSHTFPRKENVMSILKRLSMKLFTLNLHRLALTVMVLALAGTATAANLKRAYVVNLFDGTVSVIDTTNNTVVARIAVGNAASDAAVAPDGKHVYVVTGFGTVSVIDTSTNAVTATIPVGGQTEFLAVAPDGHHVYATDTISNTVSVIATASNTVTAKITVGLDPHGVAVTPDSARVYVANEADNTVSVIDAATNTVLTTVPVGSNPIDIAITPNGQHAYVTNFSGNTVSVIATATNTVIATIPVGASPLGLAITPDGKHVYVTNTDGNTISVIDTSTNTVTAAVVVGNRPIDVAVTADGHQAYVANESDNTVSVIATATNTVATTVVVGDHPFAVATQPRHARKNHEHEDDQADEGNGAKASPTRSMSGAAVSASPIRLSLQNAPAGGRVMNATPPPTQNLALNLLNSPTWYTDQPYTGTFEPEAVFEVHMPCTLGLGVLVTYTLAATDLTGASVHTLGQTTQLLSLCTGEQIVTIPVATPFDLNNQLLKLTISTTVGANLNMQLGQNTFLLSTDYVGEP
jgi:YVTN family beta-propeller protein